MECFEAEFKAFVDGKGCEIKCHESRHHLTRREAAVELVGGSVGGMLGRLVEYPFDTIKVQQQLHGSRGSLQTFKSLLAHGGIRSLYRGVVPPMTCSVVESAVCFPVYGMMGRFIQGNKSEPLTLTQSMACGAVAGAVVAHLLTPIELIKCRMQAGALAQDTSRFPRYASSWCCFKAALKAGGPLALYRGHAPTLMREICGNAAMYSTFEMVSRRTSPDSYCGLAIAGGFAGMMYWLIPFPIDTVKSYMQTYHGDEASRPTFRATARDLFGKRMLFSGLSVTMLRAAPGTAVVFFVVEESKRLAGL